MSIGIDIICLKHYFPGCIRYSMIHSTDLYIKLNICFIIFHSNIFHFTLIFSFPILFLHRNVSIMRRLKIKSKHSLFPLHSFFVIFGKNNSAKVILIFDIEYLKLVLAFLEI